MRTLLITATSIALIIAVGCGEEPTDDDNMDVGAEWQSYPDEDSTGELVEGTTWVHEPTFQADQTREFLYKISTNRQVDVFVAPASNCTSDQAHETHVDVGSEFQLGDYSHEVDSGTEQPVCVHFTADLISATGSWHVEILVREP